MKKLFTFSIVVLGLLPGCGSFNTYSTTTVFSSIALPDSEPSKPEIEVPPVIKAIPELKKLEPVCGPYKLPVLPKRPELPYRELAAITGSSQAIVDMAIDNVQIKHIADLRKYTDTILRKINESHAKYLKDCGLLPPGH